MNEEQTTPAKADEAPAPVEMEAAAPSPEGPARAKARAGTAQQDERTVNGKEARARPKRRRKVSVLTQNKVEIVDYKDVGLLKRFVNEQGKILSARQTGNTAKQQRMVARAIRRAREMALMPFVALEVAQPERAFRSEGRPPRRADKEGREQRATANEPPAQPESSAQPETE